MLMLETLAPLVLDVRARLEASVQAELVGLVSQSLEGTGFLGPPSSSEDADGGGVSTRAAQLLHPVILSASTVVGDSFEGAFATLLLPALLDLVRQAPGGGPPAPAPSAPAITTSNKALDSPQASQTHNRVPDSTGGAAQRTSSKASDTSSVRSLLSSALSLSHSLQEASNLLKGMHGDRGGGDGGPSNAGTELSGGGDHLPLAPSISDPPGFNIFGGHQDGASTPTTSPLGSSPAARASGAGEHLSASQVCLHNDQDGGVAAAVAGNSPFPHRSHSHWQAQAASILAASRPGKGEQTSPSTSTTQQQQQNSGSSTPSSVQQPSDDGAMRGAGNPAGPVPSPSANNSGGSSCQQQQAQMAAANAASGPGRRTTATTMSASLTAAAAGAGLMATSPPSLPGLSGGMIPPQHGYNQVQAGQFMSPGTSNFMSSGFQPSTSRVMGSGNMAHSSPQVSGQVSDWDMFGMGMSQLDMMSQQAAELLLASGAGMPATHDAASAYHSHELLLHGTPLGGRSLSARHTLDHQLQALNSSAFNHSSGPFTPPAMLPSAANATFLLSPDTILLGTDERGRPITCQRPPSLSPSVQHPFDMNSGGDMSSAEYMRAASARALFGTAAPNLQQQLQRGGGVPPSFRGPMFDHSAIFDHNSGRPDITLGRVSAPGSSMRYTAQELQSAPQVNLSVSSNLEPRSAAEEGAMMGLWGSFGPIGSLSRQSTQLGAHALSGRNSLEQPNRSSSDSAPSSSNEATPGAISGDLGLSISAAANTMNRGPALSPSAQSPVQISPCPSPGISMGIMADGGLNDAGSPAGQRIADLPPRFKPLPAAVQQRIMSVCAANPVVSIKDFDEKVTNKLALLVEQYGRGEALAMLDHLEHRMRTKQGTMKNGPGYLDVAVCSHLDMLKAQGSCPKSMPLSEYAKQVLAPPVFHELKQAVSANRWLEWEHFDQGIIQLIKRLPKDSAVEKLQDISYHSFKNVDNVKGCIMSILNSKIREDRRKQ